jgi:hypothetical protein
VKAKWTIFWATDGNQETISAPIPIKLSIEN